MYENKVNFETNSSGTGASFCTLLLLLFIGFKLAGIIDWPWVWVLAPFWIPLLIVVIIFIFFLIYDRKKKWWK